MGRTSRWLRSLLGGKKEEKVAGFSSSSSSEEKREKKRWSFKAGRDSADIRSNHNPIPPAEDGATWLRTFYSENEKEQNKHAIAVAAATAAAADAAVAAAQAAVAVVRLTGQGRAEAFQQRFSAAIVIQTVFRGYLAKRALRALKSLVKLQALVRGYLVRKQAAATLQSMQALIRAQSTVRAQKCRNLIANDCRRFQPEFVPRKSLVRHENSTLPIFHGRSGQEETSIHGRRLSANLDSPKIVEIDTCRAKSRSSRSRTSRSLIDSAEDVALNSISSSLPPSRVSIPDCHNFQENDWCRYSATAQSTPRYTKSVSAAAPVTPGKSVSAADVAFWRFLNLSGCPNYMSSTQSFEAKVRSQSAPKQRPEAGPRKRVPLSEVLLESRASLSGVGMQRSCDRIREAFNLKSAVMDSLDQELELDLQRKW